MNLPPLLLLSSNEAAELKQTIGELSQKISTFSNIATKLQRQVRKSESSTNASIARLNDRIGKIEAAIASLSVYSQKHGKKVNKMHQELSAIKADMSIDKLFKYIFDGNKLGHEHSGSESGPHSHNGPHSQSGPHSHSGPQPHGSHGSHSHSHSKHESSSHSDANKAQDVPPDTITVLENRIAALEKSIAVATNAKNGSSGRKN
jgi:uncharacterized coiled-coil protein SlyX/uncharacterized small protein (DUF1192 family)